MKLRHDGQALTPEIFASEKEISQRLQINEHRLRAAVEANRLAPDAVSGHGRIRLYRVTEERLTQILQIVNPNR